MNPADPNLAAWATIIQTVGGVFSIVVAIAALFVSMRSEARAIKREGRLAAANVKPLLEITTATETHLRAIYLDNHGLGTAVIRSISFSRPGLAPKLSLADTVVADLPSELGNTSLEGTDYQPYTSYLRSGSHIPLLIITQEPDQPSTLYLLDDNLASTRINIIYEDVLGNTQPDYEYNLSHADFRHTHLTPTSAPPNINSLTT